MIKQICEQVRNYLNNNMKDEIDDLIVEYNKIDDRKENEQKSYTKVY